MAVSQIRIFALTIASSATFVRDGSCAGSQSGNATNHPNIIQGTQLRLGVFRTMNMADSLRLDPTYGSQTSLSSPPHLVLVPRLCQGMHCSRGTGSHRTKSRGRRLGGTAGETRWRRPARSLIITIKDCIAISNAPKCESWFYRSPVNRGPKSTISQTTLVFAD